MSPSHFDGAHHPKCNERCDGESHWLSADGDKYLPAQPACTELRVRFDELLPVKTAARELPSHLDRLGRGEVQHLVITRRGVPRAVLITVERYEELLRNG